MATAVVGRGTSEAFGVALDSLGRIILCGSAVGSGGQIGLARFRPSGRLDRSFSGNGKLTKNLTSGRDIVFSVAVQPDDRIVVGGIAAGGSNSRMLAMRFNVDGAADDTFSGNGNVSINVTPFEDDAYGVALQDDGRIVLAGSANYQSYSIVRLDSDGTRDATFGFNGVMLVDVTASYDIACHAAIQADGRIVAVGGSGGNGGRLSAVRLLGQ